jgi:hypothetical protein
VVIIKMILNLLNKMAATLHRPLKAHDISCWRRRYDLSKQLQDFHTDMALFSETHLRTHERFFIPNYTDRFPGRKVIPMPTHETTPSSRQRRCYIRTTTAKVQLQKKKNGGDPHMSGAKKNSFALNRQSQSNSDSDC